MSRPQNEMEMMEESNDELSHDHESRVPNHESQHHHEEYTHEYWTNNSTSSLSGGFTTITNLDAAVDGNGNQNAGSPSRSVFQFMGGMDSPQPHATTTSSSNNNSNSINNNDNGSHTLGSFQSYYEMQRNGPYILDTDIRQDHMLKHQDSSYVDAAEDGRRHHRASNIDPDDGGFCDHAECANVDIISDVSTNGKNSSLSSITNDFFPKFNGKGRFLNYGHKKKLSSKSTRGATTNNTTTDSKASPPSSNENNASSSQSERRLSSTTPSKKLFTGSSINNGKRKKNNLVTGSPWYHVSRIQLQPHHYLEPHGNNHHHPQIEAVGHIQLHQQHPGINREQQVQQHPTRAPPPDSIIIRPPREVRISHNNKGQQFEDFDLTPSQTPSVISSDFSQFFTNELRERYRRSNLSIHRSYHHRYNQFIGNSSRAKKIFVVSLSLVFLLGLIAIATLTMGSRRRNGDQGMGIDGAGTVEYGDLSLPNRDGLPEACCMKGYDGLDALPPDEGEDGVLYENNSLDNDGDEEDKLDDVEDDKKAPLNELGSLTVGIQTAATTGAPSPKPITPTTSIITSSASTEATTAATSHELTDSSTPPEEMQFAKDQINVADWVQAFATTGKPTTGSPTTRMPVPSPPTTMAPMSSSPTTSKPTTKMPSRQPSSEPTKAEFVYSTSSASVQAVTRRPTKLPSNFPSIQPLPQPTREPWARPRPVTRQPTRQPSRKPTLKPAGQEPAPRPVPKPVKVTPQSSLVRIKSVDATINESRPNRNYGEEEFLSIKGNTKVAIIRFDVGPLQGYTIGKATLRLYTAFDEDNAADEEEAGSGPINIKVDLLPQSGMWNEDLISWSNGIKTRGALRAGTFTAREVGSNDKEKKKHEVDVTSVIANLLSPPGEQSGQQPNPAKVSHEKRNGRFYVTFRLSSDTGRSISFASREWRGGSAEPELSVMLAPAASPTSSPSTPITPSPSTGPSQEPTKAPVTNAPSSGPTESPVVKTGLPTSSPVRSPSVSPSSKPTMAPSKSPEAATTTSTTSTTTTTISFTQCPQKFMQSSEYKYMPRMDVSYPSRLSISIHEVYRCEGVRCNGSNHVPGSLASDWTLLGSCPTSTLTTTSSTTTASSTTTVLIMNKPSSSPSPAPSLKPSPSPTNVETATPTSKPSPSPTVKPSPSPMFSKTESPTVKPTSTPEPTPVPTPSPTPLPTIKPTPNPVTPEPTPLPTPHPVTPEPTPLPTPHPVTPEPTPLPTPNPVTPEPSPEPSPPPSPEPSPPPSTELFK